MRHLRAILRIFLMILWTGSVALVFLPLGWLGNMSRRAVLQLQMGFLRAWAWGVAAICGMRIRREGTPPTAPFVLVARPLSYVDLVLLTTQVDGFFLIGPETLGHTLPEWLARGLNTIVIDEEQGQMAAPALRRVEAILQAGHGVVFLSPAVHQDEADGTAGTRAAFVEALATRFPVHAVVIEYEAPRGHPPAATSIHWRVGMGLSTHLYRLLQMPWFQATAIFGEGVRGEEERGNPVRVGRKAMKRGFRPAPAHPTSRE